MFRLSKAFLFSLLFTSVSAVVLDDDLVGHFEAPEEQDVVNPPALCLANREGFGGVLTNDFFVVEYYYEMEYDTTGGASVEDMIASFEQDSTNFVLQSNLFDLPCSQVVARQGFTPAEGISANPLDEALEGIACTEIEIPENSSTDCVVVAGAFQVYYIDDGTSTAPLEAQFQKEIEDGINNGLLSFSHPNIKEIVAVPDPTANNGGGDQINTPDDIQTNPGNDGNNTPVIIGATVGALLIVGAAALYRRKQLSNPADTPDPASATEV